MRDTDLHAGTSVLVADYCFAWGYRLACGYGSWVGGAFAQWTLDIAELRADGVRGYDYFSSAFELSMRVGGQLAHADRDTVDRLGDIGRGLGRVLGASEEALARAGLPHHLGGGIEGLRAAELILSGRAEDRPARTLMRVIREESGQVEELLLGLEPSLARQTLIGVSHGLVERCNPILGGVEVYR